MYASVGAAGASKVYRVADDVLNDVGEDGLDGISLADSILSGALPQERSVFCQYSGNPTVGDIRRTVITRRFKCTYTPEDVPELYDLEDDPLETVNLASDPAYAQVIGELRRECTSWAESHGDWVTL